ncbi:MAG: sodium-dependent transporter [Candidatus Paceibacterota bacterium]
MIIFRSLKRLFGEHRTQWSSERAFVYATIAAAVGLGNIWRFPYLAGENGGAAFVIAYLIAVFFLGLPLMMIELSAGRIERGSPVRTFRRIFRPAGWFGWLVVGLTLLIMSYYLVVTGWTLAYAIGSSSSNGVKPFSEFLSGYDSLYYFMIVAGLTALIVRIGIRAIELLSRLMMPFLAIVVLSITLYSLTLPGAGQAVMFLFNPDFAAFASPSLWLIAFGQAFYSLAVGQGYLITYGSFLPAKTKIPRATIFVALVETSFAIIAGLMIFPLVFTVGIDPAEGTRLAFEALPHAFSFISYGSLLAILFFWLFFLAAFSSCVAGMEVVKTAFKEEWRISSQHATFISFLLIFPLGTLAALSFSPLKLTLAGRPFLEVLDLFAANQIVVVCALVGGAIITWLLPRATLVDNLGTEWKSSAWWTITVIRYLPIAALILSLLTWFVD